MKNILKRIIGIKNTVKLIQFKAMIKIKGLNFMLSKNTAFKDKYKDKRCFIFGNGPSIRNIDFELFENEFVFTVNQMPRNPDYYKLKSNFHVWADPIFYNIDQSKPEDIELLNVMKNVNTSNNRPEVFYDFQALPMIEKYKLRDFLNINIYGYCEFNEECMFQSKLPLDRLLPHFPTVVHYAICLAVYMGFTEIYLLGCECTGFISTANSLMQKGENAQYGYTISENEKIRLEKNANFDRLKGELRSAVLIFEMYERLNTYCKNNNVILYNSTEGGLLKCLPYKSIKDILHGVNS